jgi:hypothetical protein
MNAPSSVEMSKFGSIANRFLSWRCLRLVAIAYTVAMLLVWLMWLGSWASSRNGQKNGGTGDVIGADFPAFYTAGWMLRHGESDRLYDFKRQQQWQQTFFPRAAIYRSGVSAYINPPHHALLMQPLSTLPYPKAFAMWASIQVACLAVSLALLRHMLPTLRTRCGALLIALAVLFAPVYFFISGGQNTGLTLLLHTSICVALTQRRAGAQRNGVAGVLIAAGSLKPRLFLPLSPLLAFAGRWRAVVASIFGTVFVGALTLLGGTTSWRSWIYVVRSPAYDAEIAAQIHGMYSWPAFWKLLMGHNFLAAALGYGFALVTFVVLCFWWRAATNPDMDFALLYALTVCGTILMSPHLFTYDLALLVLPGLVIADRVLNTPLHQHYALRLCLLVLYGGAVFVDQALWTRVQFLVPVLTATVLLAARLLPQNQNAAVAPLQSSTA